MEHTARMSDMGNAYKIIVGRYEGKIPSRERSVRYNDNIKMSKKYDVRVWIGRVGSEYGPIECSCENGDEFFSSINGWYFLCTRPGDYWFDGRK
jgi:hypothetical protein